MPVQPRQRAGTHRGAVPVGGQYTHKPVPEIDVALHGFDGDGDVFNAGTKFDWNDTAFNGDVVFTRNVTTAENGETVATFTTDCEPPDMLLLAKRGDIGYWSDNRWHNPQHCKLWSVEITRQMLNEGLVAPGVEPIRTAMSAATNPDNEPWRGAPDALTGVVAQIRGAALLISMAGPTPAPTQSSGPQWWTTFAGTAVTGPRRRHARR